MPPGPGEVPKREPLWLERGELHNASVYSCPSFTEWRYCDSIPLVWAGLIKVVCGLICPPVVVLCVSVCTHVDASNKFCMWLQVRLGSNWTSLWTEHHVFSFGGSCSSATGAEAQCNKNHASVQLRVFLEHLILWRVDVGVTQVWWTAWLHWGVSRPTCGWVGDVFCQNGT